MNDSIFKLENLIKTISVGVFVFLVLNFIFNIGYFTFIGLKFLTLLELRDYYEGTAPLSVFVLILFMGLTNAFLYSKHIKFALSGIKYLYRIALYFGWYLITLRTKYKNLDFNKKRQFIQAKNKIKNGFLDKELFLAILYSIPFVLLLILPLWQLSYWVLPLSKVLFWVIFCIYLILLLCYFYATTNTIKITSIIFVIVSLFYSFGCWEFIRDYNKTGTKVVLSNNQIALLIRPIAKGILVKDKNNITFYKWSDVKQISKTAPLKDEQALIYLFKTKK